MIYFVFLCISCFFLYYMGRVVLKAGNSQLRISIGEIVAIALFAFLTAARASSVGTDTINYVYSAKNVQAAYSSLASIFHGYYIEPGYGALEYISMKWLGDVHFLFLIEALILLFGVFSFIHNFEGKISVAVAFLVFFSFYFNTSLNISRQYISVGIGFFAAKYLLDNRKIQYFACCLLATLFHSTGVLLFFSYITWRFLFSAKNSASVRRRVFLLVGGIILGCISIRPLTVLMANLGIIPAKYVGFLRFSESSSSALLTIIANSPLLLMIIYLRGQLLNYDSRNKLVITLYLLGFFVSMLNTVFGNVGRLAVFWTSWQIILYPECYNVIFTQQKSRFGRFITTSIFLLFFLSYWYYCVIYRGFGGTSPYVSDIFTWLNWPI